MPDGSSLPGRAPAAGARPAAPLSLAVLEDDPVFAADLLGWLGASGAYQPTHFACGKACLDGVLRGRFDLCLFDWEVPGMNGPAVLTELRARGVNTPVIFLTAVDSPALMSQVLLAGADDYVSKPPQWPVLQARMQALLRRSGRLQQSLALQEPLGRLWVDYTRGVVLRDGQPVQLTPKERQLAFHLLRHRGELLTRQHLYEVIGVTDLAVDTRRLDVHLSHLRNKMGWTADQGWRLMSVHQQGYRLEHLES